MSEHRWETVYRHSEALSKRQTRVGTPWYTLRGPLSKGQRGGGRHCTDTQDVYIKVRGELGSQFTDTQDLFLEVRGEVGDSVHILSISIFRKEDRR